MGHTGIGRRVPKLQRIRKPRKRHQPKQLHPSLSRVATNGQSSALRQTRKAFSYVPKSALMAVMGSNEIRKRFLDFFALRGHTIVPSSSLIPDDPSVLLTTAGMQQFKSYYTGEADPMSTVHLNLGRPLGSLNAATVQKSFRTSDIDSVGDESHLTFFEMLGNFSFGGYFKKEAIIWAHEFITKEMGLKISYVTIFKGSAEVPKDEESRVIWNSLGITDTDIREQGIEDVFWGPTGSSGPCGPTTEIYCKNAAGQDIEVWNLVFNEFFYPGSREELLASAPTKKLEPLKTPGVDTGMGLERLAMVAQKKSNIFETDLFTPLIALLPDSIDIRKKRVVVDHLRSAVFLASDGIRPSNKEAGYVLRRLLRRVFGYKRLTSITGLILTPEGSSFPRVLQMHHIFNVVDKVIDQYGTITIEQDGLIYPELQRETQAIRQEIHNEWERFSKSIRAGIAEFHRNSEMTPEKAFHLYETYGFPLEFTNELILEMSGGKVPSVSEKDFEAELTKHQETSRAGRERKFGGHGLILDTGELKAGSEEELKKVTRLHTATHLLNAALHKVLGDEVTQRGSDITPERARFDFTFLRKVTPEELAKIEALVNEAIQKDYAVSFAEMPLAKAKASGALYFSLGRYPETVKVYTIGNRSETFSKELCGGPHVGRTGEIGHFKITKEESSSAGVRRIRAIVQ